MGKLQNAFKLDKVAEAATEDSMFAPIKWKGRRKTFPLLATCFGWGFMMTGLVAGGTLGMDMAWKDIMIALIVGNVVLMIMAILTSAPGQQTGLGNNPVYMYTFGKYGMFLPSMILCVAPIGHQAGIVGMAAQIWTQTTSGTMYVILAIVFGLLYTVTAYYGIKGLEKLSTIALIFLVGIGVFSVIYNLNKIGGWSAFVALTEANAAAAVNPTTLAMAINTIIGAWTVGSVLGADMARFAKTKKVAIWMMIVAFPITQIFLNVLGAVGGVISGSYDFTAYLGQLGFGVWFIACICMSLALWSTGDINLYFPGGSISYVFKIPFKTSIVIAGIISTIIGATGFFNHFAKFLNVISSFIAPLAGPMMAEYLVLASGKWDPKLLHKMPKFNYASLLGYILGVCMQWVWVPNNFPSAIWCLIFSFIFTLVLSFIFKAAGKPQGYRTIKHMEVAPVTPMPDDSQYGDFEANFINHQ